MHKDKADPQLADRAFDLAGAAIFLLFFVGQVFQAFTTTNLPPPNDLAANIAFDLSAVNQTRLILLFVGFCLFPLAYLAVYRRVAGGAWAQAGLAWIGLFLIFELLNRGYEIGNIFGWERAWLTAGEAIRTALAARIQLFGELQATATLLILPAYALGSACLAIAIDGRDRWSRIARLALAIHAARAFLRLGGDVLGVTTLAPIANALFLPAMLFQLLALAAYLIARPHPST